MSESIDERRGPRVRLTPINPDEAIAIEADGLGGPKLYFAEQPFGFGNTLTSHFADAAELEKWRKARTDSQAATARP